MCVGCAALGVEGQSWKYTNEHAKALGQVLFVRDEAALAVKQMLEQGVVTPSDVKVDTDLTLRIQRDDSKHASYARWLRLDTYEIQTFRSDPGLQV